MAGENGFVLRVVPEQLETKADEVTDLINDVEKAFQKMREGIEGTKKYWAGLASESHQAMFLENEKGIREAISRLREHPDDLLHMAGIYKSAERENTGLAGTLREDIIQ